MRVAPSSLRGRLVLAAVCVGAVFALLFGLAATWRLRAVEDNTVRSALLSRLALARDEVRPEGTLRPGRGSPKTDLVQILGPDGRVRAARAGLADVSALVSVTAVRASGPSGTRVLISLQEPDVDLAVLGVPLVLPAQGSSPAGTGALVVAVDAEGYTAARTDLMTLLLVGLGAVVVATALLSWFLSGRALRSVTRLTEKAEQVGTRALEGGLPVPDGDTELARLVGALNRMLARLHAGHARELAFAADAGHRLRTPVATLRAEAELALREDDPAEQVLALERIVHDADQLTLIVDRMLARSSRRASDPQRVRDALASAQARWDRQAGVAKVALTVTVEPAIPTTATLADLPDVLDPIVDNAVRHTPEGGWVTVAARADTTDGWIVVDVANSGSGVPPHLAPQIFDAWVSSRDASAAGGLGLWLARETARDSGGDVRLTDAAAGHTTFRAHLPVLTHPLTD